MRALFHGVTRDQFMARHRANHVNVAYAPTGEIVDKALATNAAMLQALGLVAAGAGVSGVCLLSHAFELGTSCWVSGARWERCVPWDAVLFL